MDANENNGYRFVNYVNLSEHEKALVWSMRNLPEIRKWMTHSELINWDSHVQFLNSLSKRVDLCHYLVYYCTHVVGAVNYTLLGDGVVERGIYINPTCQGKGHAKNILNIFYSYLKEKLNICVVKTRVLKENLASIALEESIGAQLVDQDAEYFYFSLIL